MALGLGWTMNEVRAHTWRDLQAITERIEDRQRRERMRRAAKGLK